MSSPCVFFLWLVLSISVNSVTAVYKYTLVMPKTVRIGSPVMIYFTLHDCMGSTCPVTLQTHLENIADAQPVNVSAPVISIQNSSSAVEGSTTVLYLETQSSQLFPMYYNLTVQDESGSIFETSTLQVLPTASRVFIQTDKPQYKPGQTINIRVLQTDENLIPLNTPFNVSITNSADVKLRNWVNVTPEIGIADLSLDIVDNPPLGVWNITVYTERGLNWLAVNVIEYVLPRFEVTLDAPEAVVVDSGRFNVTVSAYYTFGDPVSGYATVNLTKIYRPFFTIVDTRHLHNVTLPLSGSTVFTLDKKLLEDEVGWDILVEVEVVEPLSGEINKAKAVMKLTTEEYSIEISKLTNRYYRPGLPFTLYYQVSRSQSSDPVPDNLELSVEVKKNGDGGNVDFFNVPSNGIVAVHMTVDSNTVVLSFSAELRQSGFKKILASAKDESIPKFETENPANLFKLTPLTDYTNVYKVDTTVKFRLAVNEGTEMNWFNYIVLGNGVPISSALVNFSKTDTIEISLTPVHSPLTTLLVYGDMNGELVADSATFNVNGTFKNQISAEFSEETVRPGENLTLDINGVQGSLVGLVSVDKSVLLLGKPNWITTQQVRDMRRADYIRKANCDIRDEDGATPAVIPDDFPYIVEGELKAAHVLSVAGYVVRSTLQHEACNPVRRFLPDMNKPSTRRERNFFPETWLWQLYKLNSSSASIQLTAPDTITSWETHVISMHPTQGLAIAERIKVKAKKDLFIEPVLPYSMIKGEKLVLTVLVFNYKSETTTCNVTFYNSTQVAAMPDTDSMVVVELAANSKEKVKFIVNPLEFGEVFIKIEASCTNGAYDAVRKSTLVKPPGDPTEQCFNEFLILGNSTRNISIDKKIKFPSYAVEGSMRITATLTGDPIGGVIDSLGNLLKIPVGCGEQTMMLMAPSIFIRQYLDTLEQPDSTAIKKTNAFMLSGYLKEMKFYRTDGSGSFSAFGDADTSGSTWLTAFVVKCFRQAQPYIADTLDSKVMDSTRQFVAAQVREDGAFTEQGRVIHVEMQGGGVSHRFAFSAFCVIALLEDDAEEEVIRRYLTVAKSKDYLEGAITFFSNDVYQLSIVTYALVLLKSPKVSEYMERLERLAKQEDGIMYWPIGNKDEDDENKLFDSPVSGVSTIEATSYALLAYVKMGELQKARLIAKFLIRVRNKDGGFASTQDTVLGLQALAAFSKAVKSKDYSVAAKFTVGDLIYTRSVNRENFLVSQEVDISTLQQNEVSIKMEAEGSGAAVLGVCASYNSNNDVDTNEINLNVTTEIHPTQNMTFVNACAVAKDVTGMSLISITMPSGFFPIYSRIRSEPVFKMREINHDGSVAIYFDNFTSDYATCVSVLIEPQVIIQEVQQAFVKAYDYYKNDRIDVKPFKPLYHSPLESTTTTKPFTDGQVNENNSTGQVILPCLSFISLSIFCFAASLLCAQT